MEKVAQATIGGKDDDLSILKHLSNSIELGLLNLAKLSTSKNYHPTALVVIIYSKLPKNKYYQRHQALDFNSDYLALCLASNQESIGTNFRADSSLIVNNFKSSYVHLESFFQLLSY